jgi:hypothetical protein
MISIRGPTDLSRIADRDLRSLISLRMSQLGGGEPYNPQAHGELYVVEEGDTAEALETATGVFITTNPFDGLRFGDADFCPAWEFVEEHATCFEMAFQLSDESAVAILVPKHPGIDAVLLALCAGFAVPAAPLI